MLGIGCLNSQVVSAQTKVEARQGDAMYVSVAGQDTVSMCTISYNDRAKRQSVTAAHCGEDGATVFLRDSNDDLVEAGILHPSKQHSSASTANDWALVHWKPTVRVGKNTFSGDKQVPLEEMEKGDKVCVRGATSHGETRDGYSCGSYLGAINNSFIFTESGTDGGDSGGAVFAPGRGYLGVLSGSKLLPGGSSGQRQTELASVPQDGRIFGGAEHTLFTYKAIDHPMGSAYDSERSSQGSSMQKPDSELSSKPGLATDEILLIVLNSLAFAAILVAISLLN